MEPWDLSAAGVMALPSGRLIRGRGLRRGLPEGPAPEFGLYLQGRRPPEVLWDARWVRWRDFGVPADPADARAALIEAWRRSATERVEVACTRGHGRTASALACIAILDGVPPRAAAAYVRAHYGRRPIETPGQYRFVRGFRPEL